MNSNNSSITFCFPYKPIGGVSVLFANLAKHITKNYNQKVNFVDYKDGYVASIFKGNNQINFIEYKDGEKLELPPNTTLILQSIIPYTMPPELKIDANTRILFWTLLHYNMIPDLIPIKPLRHIHHRLKLLRRIYFKYLIPGNIKRLAALIQKMHSHQAILFMDSSTLSITEEFLGIKINNPNILPLCTDSIEKVSINKQISPNSCITICWIGRVEDFKTSILEFSITQARNFSNKYKQPIRFVVIGYGKDLKNMKKSFKPSKNFKIEYKGTLSGKKLNNYLISDIDLLMSMGTSALVGAKLGIPTVLLDASNYKIPNDYKYKWLFESDGATLGSFIESQGKRNNGHSFQDVIYSLYNNYNDLSSKTVMYVNDNHNIDVISKRLIDIVNNSAYKWSDMDDRIKQKSPLRRLYEFLKSVKLVFKYGT